MKRSPVFDPFGDFEAEGYLRNELRLKDPASIKAQEHLFFTANLPDAAAYLELGNDPEYIAKRPGEVMGLFAWGHPFLDGNGRAMVVVHTELMARAGLMVNWAASVKDLYLEALTRELDSPRDRVLDGYLLPLVQPLQNGPNWFAHIRDLPGLDGTNEDIDADVAYGDNDPVGERSYNAKVRARQYTIPDTRTTGGDKLRGGKLR